MRFSPKEPLNLLRLPNPVRKQGKTKNYGRRKKQGMSKDHQKQSIYKDRVQFKDKGCIGKKTQCADNQQQQRLYK